MRIANALVDNPLDIGVVEMTLIGVQFVVEAEAARFAVVGADMPITINGRSAEHLRAHDLTRGDRVEIGRAKHGMRGYLACAGGFDVAAVLGSVSTHTRSRVGGLDGSPLEAGVTLPLRGGPSGSLKELNGHYLTMHDGSFRVVLGPQDDRFTDEGITTFLSSIYRLSHQSDRMGFQLEGTPVKHTEGFNIVSDGIANGSIQIPGHGRPIILLADRQTTGGYPKIATLISADLGRLAQLRPGDDVSFTAITAAEASVEAKNAAKRLDAALNAIRPAATGSPSLLSERLLTLNLIDGIASASDNPFDRLYG
jgi:5-oxoprolinase (ATP-hydrolysing) subunit C